jgi:O-methyltransferase
MRIYKNDMKTLFNELWNGVYTQVEEPRFDILDQIAKEIYDKKLDGDIVECGVWRGGVLVYLSYLFHDKKIWGLDSFEGFQKLEDAQYQYDGIERHVYSFDELHNSNGQICRGYPLSISIEEVKNNLKSFGLSESDGINLLKGFVRDTTNSMNCPIDKISLLRVDVDGYSPTLEVLMNLYDKVVIGGYIVFDDIPLYECQDAIRDFQKIRNINIELIGDSKQSDYFGGNYFIKE